MAAARSRSGSNAFDSMMTATFGELAQARVVDRVWAKDHTLWKPEPTEIENRLGWLTVADQMRQRVAELRTFAQSVCQQGMKDVVLLGMGGSSLGPEVFRCTFGSARGFPRLWVLDSTVPGFVRQVTDTIDPARSLFLVASKSGGTIEVMSLFAHFWELVNKTTGSQGGAQFIAITDPGTGLERMARDYRFWQTFTNQPDIGGRYSVLSYFGLVPAALIGMDVGTLLDRACAMAASCRHSAPLRDNPGAYLGAMMGTLGRAGRDKVTIVASPKVGSFGLWAEQLIAESTGKEGTGLVPVAQEPLAIPSAYGEDRLFVYLRLAGDANATTDRQVQAIERAGHPVLRLSLRDRYDLGAEFFRWEFATAIAGHVFGIHPFDQPNVQESKDNTQRVLQQVEASGKLPTMPSTTPAQAGKKIVDNVRAGQYLAILTYATPSPRLDAALRSLRKSVLTLSKLATTSGYGPRYLHSTGQLHKGGPNNGRFLELVEEMTPDLPIPGKPFSFGTLAQAQAVGDLQSLHAHDRPAIRVRLGPQPLATIRSLINSLKPRTKPSRPVRAKKRTKRPRRSSKR